MRSHALAVPAQQDAPLVEQAYHALRRALIHCEYEPGQRLRVEELQRRLGFSSSPLREALNRLVRDGLVRTLEHRGFRVAPITVEAVADLTRVRLLLETEALRESIRQGDDRWEASLVAAFHHLSLIETRMGTQPMLLNTEWSRSHRTFHLTTYAASSSPLLREMVEDLFDQAERFRWFSSSFRKAERSKHDEHKNLFDAILAREADKAAGLLEQHVRRTERNVIDSLLALQQQTLTAQ
ncbi:GntR family transcriptional regulator [Xanthomonas campestris pv. campestris]|nr:GntR family transcriptional regulator [Xanthomonas campestris pv. campestris]